MEWGGLRGERREQTTHAITCQSRVFSLRSFARAAPCRPRSEGAEGGRCRQGSGRMDERKEKMNRGRRA